METATDVEAAVAAEIRQRVSPLIPPRTMDQVLALGRAGEFTFELLADVEVTDRTAAIYSTRLAANLGGPIGLQFIERLARADDLVPSQVLVSYWDEFEPVEYAKRVLADRNIRSANIVDPELIQGVLRLPSIEALGCRCGRAHTDFSFLAQMPNLHHIGIFVEPDHGPLRVIPPPGARTLLLSTASQWNRPTSAASSDSPSAWATGRTQGTDEPMSLLIVNLHSARMLAGLDLAGPVSRLTIRKDPGLTDLADLKLPAELEILELSACPELASLEGIATHALPRLRELSITRLQHRLPDLDPLLRPAAGLDGKRLIDQVHTLRLSYANARAAEVGNPLAELNPLGFHFLVDSSGPEVALVAYRRTNPGA